MHKGWLAFGVESDNFCLRETTPQEASIANVGMTSLVTSKFYGLKGKCNDPSSIVVSCGPGACDAGASNTTCTSIDDGGSTPTSCNCAWTSTGGSGPGKHNFIGFGATNTNCTDASANQLSVANIQILGEQGGVATTADTQCELDVDEYQIGVYGNVGGKSGYGISVQNTGVFSDQQDIDQSSGAQNANAGCS